MSDGIFLRVWEETGSVIVDPAEKHSIDAAVSQWLREGRDSLLHLTTASGEEYVTRASGIQCWLLSTPEGRMRSIEIEKWTEEERKHQRAELGLGWEDHE